jgi:hypothetical protein
MGSQFAAVHSHADIMTENDRIVMEFDSREFGTVVQVGDWDSPAACQQRVPYGRLPLRTISGVVRQHIQQYMVQLDVPARSLQQG